MFSKKNEIEREREKEKERERNDEITQKFLSGLPA